MKKIAVLGDTIVDKEIFGVQRYALEILKELDNLLDNESELEFFVVIPTYKECYVNFKNIKIAKYGKIKKAFLWRQISFVNYAKKNKCLTLDFTLGLTIRKCDYVCLHDVIIEDFKNEFKGFKQKINRLFYLFRARIVTKKAKTIFSVSKTSANLIMQKYKLKKEVEVVYNAWQHFALITPDFSILKNNPNYESKKYFFTLGSYLPHKNIKWVIEASKQNPEFNFIITGSNKWSKEDLPNNISNLFFTGYISDSCVKALMIKSEALILPSFVEGFGIPPLEALSCNTKIIVSNVSCLPEIYQDAAIYINPYDYNIDMEKILNQVVPDSSKVLNEYSWEKSAKKLLNMLLS